MSMRLVQVILLLVLAGAGYWRLISLASAEQQVPADLFMQSVATDDGALGWNQLCPSVQKQLPREVLVQHTALTRVSHAEMGRTLRIDFVGERPRATGGAFRFYIVTASAADGSSGQRTYVLQTQASGCVESVQ
jgi:hypothetical protein